MKPRVYIETTIPSYLTARPTRDLVRAAHQQITREWWASRERFELVVSQAVLDEAAAGDPDAARRRLRALDGLPSLDVTEEVADLAEALIIGVPFPPKAAVDAVHIAAAVVNRLDYLVTWNCTHLANAEMRKRVEQVCRSRGYEPVVICTPEELMGGQDEPA